MSVVRVEPEILGEVLESMIEHTKEFRTEVVLRLREELQQRGKEGLRLLFQVTDSAYSDGLVDLEHHLPGNGQKRGWRYQHGGVSGCFGEIELVLQHRPIPDVNESRQPQRPWLHTDIQRFC